VVCRASRKGPATPILDELLRMQTSDAHPDADQQFPSGWHVQQRSDIHFFNVAGPAWASLDYHLNPWGLLSDGLFELTTDRCKGRVEALKMVLQTQSGAHETSPLFETVKIGAFGIIPDSSKSTHVVVDGEEVAFEPLFLEVHAGLLTVVQAAGLNAAV
jgi:diacylglycerol kinase family enzyme